MRPKGMWWGPDTHGERFLLSYDADEENPLKTCDAVLADVRDLGPLIEPLVERGLVLPLKAAEAALTVAHPNVDWPSLRGRFVAVVDPATCQRVYHQVHLEHVVKNKAQALIETALPDGFRKAQLDADGDPAIGDDGQPVKILKTKHAPRHVSGARGQYHFHLPGADPLTVEEVRQQLAAEFGSRVSVEAV